MNIPTRKYRYCLLPFTTWYPELLFFFLLYCSVIVSVNLLLLSSNNVERNWGTLNFADMEGWNVAETEFWKVVDTIYSRVRIRRHFFFEVTDTIFCQQNL